VFGINKKTAKFTPEEMNEIKENVVGTTLRIPDILNFFKYDMNPAYQDAKMTAMANRDKKKQGMFNSGTMLIIVVFLIVGAIAYTIVAGQNTNSECVRQLAAIAGNAAAKITPAATAATGVV